MNTDKQRIRLEKEFRDFIKSVHGENAWREFAGSELEGTCINFIQSQLKEVEKLNGAFPDGLGDYEWKIIENFNAKNFMINELESQNKDLTKALQEQYIINLSLSEQADEYQGKLIESIESLIILIDSRLHLMDVKIIGKGRSHIWNKVVKNAQDLIKQSKS